MKLSSSNGTLKTLEDMTAAWRLLHECYLRIQEINDGSYRREVPPIQFDYCTSPELSHSVDDIEFIIKKISDMVYQN